MSGAGCHNMNCLPPVAFPPSPPPPFGLVRRFRRYYATVRLPETVHRRLTALAFPTRPASSVTGVLRISRFLRKVFPSMCGVSDRAEPVPNSRQAGRPAIARHSVAFRASEHVGAPKLIRISWLNTRPTGSLVNASPAGLLPPTHDSGTIGSLDLYRMRLSLLTPYQFSSAHRMERITEASV